jgi:hypothetical protein
MPSQEQASQRWNSLVFIYLPGLCYLCKPSGSQEAGKDVGIEPFILFFFKLSVPKVTKSLNSEIIP